MYYVCIVVGDSLAQNDFFRFKERDRNRVTRSRRVKDIPVSKLPTKQWGPGSNPSGAHLGKYTILVSNLTSPVSVLFRKRKGYKAEISFLTLATILGPLVKVCYYVFFYWLQRCFGIMIGKTTGSFLSQYCFSLFSLFFMLDSNLCRLALSVPIVADFPSQYEEH